MFTENKQVKIKSVKLQVTVNGSKKQGGLCGGRGRCRCWGQAICESVGQFWLCG
jgi:hypothetical protein